MHLRKYKKAASMIGYGLLLGLISIVVINSLENVGKNTDVLFDNAGKKLDFVSDGNLNGAPAIDATPSNIILVNNSMTIVEGTDDNDLFIVLGENAGVDGPQKNYSSSDLTNSTGGFDVSEFVSVSDVNNRQSSSLNDTTIFNTNGGEDSLLVFGNVDLSNINPDIFAHIFINSGIKISRTGVLETVRIEGNGRDSYIEFTGDGKLILGSNVNIEDVTKIILDYSTELEMTNDLFGRLLTISGDGIVRADPVSKTLNIAGQEIDESITIADHGERVIAPAKLEFLNVARNSGTTGGDTSMVTESGYAINTKSNRSVLATFGADYAVSEGKYYWEVTTDSVNRSSGAAGRTLVYYGLIEDDKEAWHSMSPDTSADVVEYNTRTPIFKDSVREEHLTFGPSQGANGRVFKFALDADTGRLWIGRAGHDWFQGDPETGDNPAFTGLTGLLRPHITDPTGGEGHHARINFGQIDFVESPPPGFAAGFGQTRSK